MALIADADFYYNAANFFSGLINMTNVDVLEERMIDLTDGATNDVKVVKFSFPVFNEWTYHGGSVS